MSDNCPNSRMEDKKKEEDSKPHFAKVYDYAPEETWRTDMAIGQRGSERHGHLSLSGATVWYLRDEQGKEIVVNGGVVPNNTFQSQSDYKPNISEEPQHPEQSPSLSVNNSDSFFSRLRKFLQRLL